MKKQKISLLGSTGSIGKKVLDIVQKFPNKFEIEALGAAGNDMDLFAKQINQFLPKIVCLADEKKIIELKKKLHKKTEIVSGIRGSCALASFPSSDFFVSAIVGAAGLSPTISAINAQKKIALANKETLVRAGDYIMDLEKKKNVRILPIDSEHSAIFQCLEKNNKKSIKKIFLTASGGPFLHREKNTMKDITIKDALNHPNWNMGEKITIDSATMMNKGLELIEAKHLFDISEKKIEVLVHPESIIHSMVAYKDGSVMAQLGIPDMKTAIAYSLSYPKRLDIKQEIPNFAKIASLNFYAPDFKKFPCIKLAYEVLKKGGTYPLAMNAANEIAVHNFLDGRISFEQIYESIQRILDNHQSINNPSLEDIIFKDNQVRKETFETIRGL